MACQLNNSGPQESGSACDNESVYKTAMSIKASQYPAGDGKNKYIYPNEEMYQDPH